MCLVSYTPRSLNSICQCRWGWCFLDWVDPIWRSRRSDVHRDPLNMLPISLTPKWWFGYYIPNTKWLIRGYFGCSTISDHPRVQQTQPFHYPLPPFTNFVSPSPLLGRFGRRRSELGGANAGRQEAWRCNKNSKLHEIPPWNRWIRCISRQKRRDI